MVGRWSLDFCFKERVLIDKAEGCGLVEEGLSSDDLAERSHRCHGVDLLITVCDSRFVIIWMRQVIAGSLIRLIPNIASPLLYG